jgi:23S rRNA (uridine2552-2'-O)-methyltransferase
MPYQRKDAFYARAKAAGYRSRAAFKLLELARRYRLIARGNHVVDLGAWPGGWLQAAAELTGPSGMVVGVDLQPIEPVGGPVVTLVGDARAQTVQEEIRLRCGGRVDVLLSDMAPQLSGVRDRDAVRAVELAEAALAMADRLLAPGGHLLVKLFTAPETDVIVAAARQRFRAVKLTRPEATRKGSAEHYLVCLGWVPLPPLP